MSRLLFCQQIFIFIAFCGTLAAAPVLNEIFYHPPGVPEETAAEFLEVHNPTDQAFDLTGWKFTKGISFTFPEVILPAGGYLVISADPQHFISNHPDVTEVIGPWIGKLSNSGERIRLEDADDELVFDIAYADDGRWSVRERGPIHYGHYGWDWISPHDGDGYSLELIRSDFENGNPHNWATSSDKNGTPGKSNSQSTLLLAPTISDISHAPIIPKANESVVVSARVKSAEAVALEITLRYRVDEIKEVSVSMSAIGGGLYEAIIPPQADRSVIGFSITATDGFSERIAPNFEAEENDVPPLFLYQVDDSFEERQWLPGDQPRYHLVLTESEREELATIGSNSFDSESDAKMNATWISIDSSGSDYRYNVGVRNRGASSRTGPPNNYLVIFQNDQPWQGMASLKLNTRHTGSQVLGSVLFDRAGIVTADAIPVKLSVNGRDLAEPHESRMHGSYARVEAFGSEFAENHFPNDPNGNLYQVRDDEVTGQEGDLRYEGPDPDAYRDTYFKQTNASEDDWTDLIELTRELNSPHDETYFDRIKRVIDLEQWMRCLAMDALLGNREGGLTTSKGDDFALYRGITDKRFRLIPHDLDSLMGLSSSPNPDRSINDYFDLEGLQNLMGGEARSLYYKAHLDLMEEVFHPEIINPIIDRTVGDWLPQEKIQELKQYVIDRREGVLSQIPQSFTIETDLPFENGYLKTTTDIFTVGGTFPPAMMQSLRLNGKFLDRDLLGGIWYSPQLEEGEGLVRPGLNRLTLTGYASEDGTGPIDDQIGIDVWYDDGRPGKEVPYDLVPAGDDSDELVIKVRDSFYSTLPFLVRVEWQDQDGMVQRDRWDSVVQLTADEPGITFTPDTITLSNGIGCALVKVSRPEHEVTLRVSGAGKTVTRTLRDMSGDPRMDAGGLLQGDATTWSDVVFVRSDVIVPAGHTLTVMPGTLVLFEGDSTPRSTSGVELKVEGRLIAEGTSELPITFTAWDAASPWGRIHHDGSEPSHYRNVIITRAGHSPQAGHTGTGSAVRSDGATLSFTDVTISHIAGKIMQVEGDAVTFDRCLFSQSVMGPEIDDAAVFMKDSAILEMRGIYREDGINDDDDGIYLHSAPEGEEIRLLRTTIAHGDDDACDTLNAEVSIEDCIFRDFFDKGLSANGGSVSVLRNLHVNNGIGIQVKHSDARFTVSESTIAGNPIGISVLEDAESVSIYHSIIAAGEDALSVIEDSEAQVTPRYSLFTTQEEGVGLVIADPLFRSPSAGNYHLSPESPARDAGDPSSPRDPDGTFVDLGRYPFSEDDLNPTEGVVRWLAADGPYRLTEDVIIPEGVHLILEEGVAIYVEPGKKITVNGVLEARGTELSPITIGPDPAAPWVPDFREGLPDAPPKWGGIQFINSMSEDNILSHVKIAHAQAEQGSVGIIRSQVLIDHCSFMGTKLRFIYADSSSVRIEYSEFPDMFGPDESPHELGLDNVSEHIKGIGAYPEGGHFIIRGNHFGTNKGHNDIIDVDSGTWPNPILQIRENVFNGVGDELLDLGGDAYVEGNLFRNVFKDDETSDLGYANVISTGDIVEGSMIVAVRNIFYDVDHAVNLKNNVSVIFENNTVYHVHDDFTDRFGNLNVGSVINHYVDEPWATPGGGAYLSGNVLMNLPRVFGNVDQPAPHRNPLVFRENLVDPAMPDPGVGTRPGTVFDLGRGNRTGHVAFVDPVEGDFTLLSSSDGRASGPFGHDFGATAPPGAWIRGEPSAMTSSREARLVIGGAGIFAYKYRVNDGEWSDAIAIGNPLTQPLNSLDRETELHLAGLTDGTYVVHVIGQDFAGEWQAEADATESAAWTVGPMALEIVLNEVLARNETVAPINGEFPDAIELYNRSPNVVDLTGWSLSDRTEEPQRYRFPNGSQIPGHGFLILRSGQNGFDFALSDEGETLTLYGPDETVVDQVTFGFQIADYSIGRSPTLGWQLNQPTLGAPNIVQSLGDATQVYISEWLPSPGFHFEAPFIELHNPLPIPVSITGIGVTHRLHDLSQQRIFGALSFLAADGYRRLNTNRNSDGGSLPFELNPEVGSLYLIGGTGDIQDSLQIYNETHGVSVSRRIGTSDIIYQAIPTPGFSNTYDSAEASRAKALLKYLRITEIMFHAESGSDYDFIELRNVGSDPLQIGGVRFVEGIRFTSPSKLLAAGQAVVIVSDLAAFIERYGSDSDVIGTYDGNLANEGETLALQLPAPFESMIQRFRYEGYWVPGTDGEGYSLTLRDGNIGLGANSLTTSLNWTSSSEIGGTPGDGGSSPEMTYARWSADYGIALPGDDPDKDGATNLVEYALAMNPTLPDADELLFINPHTKTIHLREHIGRTDVHYFLEASADVEEWHTLTQNNGAAVSWVPEGGIAFETNLAANFVRLRLVLINP